jgi:hypothetical protein
MRRKVAAFGALTSVLAVAVMIATLLPASSATTIRVYEKHRVGFEKDINVDGKGLAGDYFVDTHPLYRAGTGKRVGRSTSQLTFVRVVHHNPRLRAAGTFKIGRGTLEVAGSAKASQFEEGTARFAITGGTGVYDGAAGTMLVRDTKHRTHFTFNVIP